MMANIHELIARGGPLYGAWATSNDPAVAEAMAGSGYDWLCLDSQHGPLDWHDLLPLLRAVGGTPTLVRTGWTDQMQIMRALDMGASGVVVPMVSTVEQAKLAAEACFYPPRGNRSFGPIRNYYAADNRPDPLCLCMIETAEGAENVEKIAAVPGVGGLLIGPADLALALGEKLEFKISDAALKVIDRVVAACEKNKKVSAMATMGPANAQAMMERGIRMVALGADMLHVRQGAAAELARARDWKAPKKRKAGRGA
jgi:4-hydroxy-2-oxoheptanedioate aldolase